jgi:hypothetical protein
VEKNCGNFVGFFLCEKDNLALIPSVISCCYRRSPEHEDMIMPLVESGHKKVLPLVESSYRS